VLVLISTLHHPCPNLHCPPPSYHPLTLPIHPSPCPPVPSPCADKARDKRTGELVALKKLRMERERDGELAWVQLVGGSWWKGLRWLTGCWAVGHACWLGC